MTIFDFLYQKRRQKEFRKIFSEALRMEMESIKKIDMITEKMIMERREKVSSNKLNIIQKEKEPMINGKELKEIKSYKNGRFHQELCEA